MSISERPSLDGVIEVPVRQLEAPEIATVVAEIVACEAAWRPHVRHDPQHRYYVPLHESEHLGVWLICWMPGHDTGWHDHAGSNGAFMVAEGAVTEERPFWGRAPLRTINRAGAAQHFDMSEIHRVSCDDEPSVTVHAYSDPLKRMGMYRFDEDGYVRRIDVSWDERLTC